MNTNSEAGWTGRLFRHAQMAAPWRPRARAVVPCSVGVALAITLSGCDGGSDPSSNGSSGPAHLDALPLLTVEEDVRVGDVEDPDLGFSRVTGLDVDRDGNVYVMEGLVPEIRVYAPGGTLLRRIGRRGGGPGEFESVPRFGVVGDTIWAVDGANERITLFDREGEVLSTGRYASLAVPLPSSHGYLVPWAMRPDGQFTGHFGRIAFSRNDPPTGVRDTDSIPWPVVLFHASGAVTDTIGWVGRPPPRMWRPPSEEVERYEFRQVGDQRQMVPNPPTTLPHWLPLPDGYLLVETPLADNPEEGVFTVTRVGLAGDTVFRRAVHYRPERYDEAELDSIAARTARGEAGGMVLPGGAARPVPAEWESLARSLRAAMEFPAYHLPIQVAWLAQDESIWLRRQESGSPTSRWVHLDPEGHPRGQLELAASTRIVWSHGDVLWAVELDEFDVPWVVRYRIREGP